MSNSANLEQNFKIGVLKELYKRQLLSKEELERAIRTLKNVI